MDRRYKPKDRVEVRQDGKKVGVIYRKPFSSHGLDYYPYLGRIYPGYVDSQGLTFINIKSLHPVE